MAIKVMGAVQGAGFRPFVYRLALEAGLTGWVVNNPQGVMLEVEGAGDRLDRFLTRLKAEAPFAAVVREVSWKEIPCLGGSGFAIAESDTGGPRRAELLPDLATCPACLAEVLDPRDRRHLYPFTNCTLCGPRYTILLRLPYERPNTTMVRFVMCADCRREYEDPLDRRFHAQPTACPRCGPAVEFRDRSGRRLYARHEALLAAAQSLRDGRIVALKGLGGYMLLADARVDEAVMRLRERKRRPDKPFAVMFPTLEQIQACCRVSEEEARLLTSPAAPIVLLGRAVEAGLEVPVARSVAPDNRLLGAMLPYTPLHHLLLRELGFPIVATSGNASEEPICIDEAEALDRLSSIADDLLVHDRPIARPVDDSVVRVVLGRELPLRRARGYAPLTVPMAAHHRPVIAVGAHLKSTVAVSVEGSACVSQHIGDLESALTLDVLGRTVGAFSTIYGLDDAEVACDLHPDYLSTRFARETGRPVTAVQHHHAHVAACLVDNEMDGPVLGVAWDGTGYGPDGSVWGGEFLRATLASYERVGHLRTFPLPGGEAAVREPRRAALGLLYELLGPAVIDRTDLAPIRAFERKELGPLVRAVERGVNCPRTSSVGRLFDAVSSLSGLCQIASFEGQAAMALEQVLAPGDDRYPVRVDRACTATDPAPTLVVDWGPTIAAIMADLERGVAVGAISGRFLNGLVEAIAVVARELLERRVVLTGGCFQNGPLLERTVRRLEADGVDCRWHRRVPPNDGGIALGQLAVVSGRGAARTS
ncbi:MAG: carbamoyltransferase HypF [Candidatus Riflebacteria bacterium]|nr:carbamoyltransferase HypF [Candidatus Riflebacteria bacterium]